jgi:hypothetical protein
MMNPVGRFTSARSGVAFWGEQQAVAASVAAACIFKMARSQVALFNVDKKPVASR